MNVALQDVRILGYKKIFLNFCSNEQKRKVFFNRMEKLNATLSCFKVQPYSFLSYWECIQSSDISEINGLANLVTTTEPLISINEPSNAVKRKFRNSWGIVWEKFGETAGLTSSEISILSDVGLKYPFVLSAWNDNEKALKLVKGCDLPQTYNGYVDFFGEFYNAVLNWYCLTQFESILTIKDKSLFDVLMLLSTKDNADFTYLMETGGNIWD